MGMSSASILRSQLTTCNVQREDAQAKLNLANQQLELMEEQVLRLEGQRDKAEILAANKQRELELVTTSRNDYSTKWANALKAPVSREQMEGLSRERLVSLIEEAINQARRRGLVEAEGLLARHRELTRETDLEMMRGVVKTYQDRITEVEARQKTEQLAAQQPVKLDTRPLAEKLSPAGSPVANYKAPQWWFNGAGNFETKAPVTYTTVLEPRKKGGEPTNYAEWDKTQRAAAADAKYAKPVGSTVTVPGSNGGTYILTRHADIGGVPVVSCTCPSWRFQKNDNARRTCKHLQGYYGETAEKERVAKALVQHCWCGVTLVRGQCQVHTRDWKGEELCSCGRKFASCKAAYDTLSIAQRKYGHQPQLTRSQDPDAAKRDNNDGYDF